MLQLFHASEFVQCVWYKREQTACISQWFLEVAARQHTEQTDEVGSRMTENPKLDWGPSKGDGGPNFPSGIVPGRRSPRPEDVSSSWSSKRATNKL